MKNKILICLSLCVLLLVTGATPAIADTTSTTTPRQGRQSINSALICQRITARVALQKQRIDDRLQITQTLFEKEDTKLADLATKAAALGVDVSKLHTDLTTWQSYTQTIRDDRTQVATDITSAVQLVCNDDRPSGREKLQDARSTVTRILQTRLDRRMFYDNTIVPDLKSVRDHLKTLKSTTTTTSTTTAA